MRRAAWLILGAALAARGLAAGSPAAAPTPEPKPVRSVRLAAPFWSMALKGGAVLPMGELSQFVASGPSLGLNLLYHKSSEVSVDTLLSYSTQPYKTSSQAQALPLSNLGLGVRLLYNLAEQDDVTWYFGIGMAGYYNQRTKQLLREPVNYAKPQFDPAPDRSFGLGFLTGIGGRYESSTGWGMIAEIGISYINLAGGTSDSLFLIQPAFGLSHKL